MLFSHSSRYSPTFKFNHQARAEGKKLVLRITKNRIKNYERMTMINFKFFNFLIMNICDDEG